MSIDMDDFLGSWCGGSEYSIKDIGENFWSVDDVE